MLTIAYLVSGQTRAEHRPHRHRVNVIRQQRQVPGVQGDVLLKAAVLVVQMVGALDAVLLCASKAKLAPAAHTAGEPDADVAADFDVVVAARAESDDAANAFVAADVRELDLGDGFAVWARRNAGLGVEIYHVSYPDMVRVVVDVPL